MISLAVLDLVPVREGHSISEALAETANYARAADQAGFKRFWVAEHHDMQGVAGGAVSVVLAHIGHATSTIRIGSGGIMLPNHNPFVIAEQFGTLDALFPGRVDLGVGRAPGAGGRIAQALRKDLMRAAEYFPQDVIELRALLTGDIELPITASPGLGSNIELWMLGSSLFGAQLAAQLGMPYAFASHFAPDLLDEALAIYRRDFKPSAALAAPHVMAGDGRDRGRDRCRSAFARLVDGAILRAAADRQPGQAAAARHRLPRKPLPVRTGDIGAGRFSPGRRQPGQRSRKDGALYRAHRRG